MVKGVNELKSTGAPARSLADLKAMDTGSFIKWRAKTTSEGYEIKGQYQPIEGRWTRWDTREATFKKDGGKEEVSQVFDYFLAQEGRERALSSGSKGLKDSMANSNGLGKLIRITRCGEGFETRYSVEVIGE